MPIIEDTTVRRYVEKLCNDNYTATPIQHENTTLDVSEETEYIAVFDSTDTAEAFGIGGQEILVHGAIVVQIFTELDEGTDRGREIASELTQLLNSESMNNFNFATPQFDSFGQVEDVDFYQHNLTIPYVYAFGAEEFDDC